MGDPVADAYREEWSRVVATLIRVTGDWSLAEECAAEAFTRAVERWLRDGVPDRPGAWLTTVARNAALDRLRRSTVERAKLQEVALMAVDVELHELPDDRLRLIFTCCHPALSLEARVALTLRTVAGLTTPEIARAFLVTDATMAQRLVRAQRKIANAGIPYRVPPAELLPERLGGVLAVLYLLFSEGYAASSGDALLRRDLAEEAIRVARLVVALMPDEPEARGLLALMLLQHSRRDARFDADGGILTLEEQDRARWHTGEITEAMAVLPGELGYYGLQAAIASVHALAPSAERTDTAALLRLYDDLVIVAPGPVVRLNRAIAVGLHVGWEAGLAEIPDFESHLVPAARADMLRRLGRHAEALAEYDRVLAPTAAERKYLAKRRAQVEAGMTEER